MVSAAFVYRHRLACEILCCVLRASPAPQVFSHVRIVIATFQCIIFVVFIVTSTFLFVPVCPSVAKKSTADRRKYEYCTQHCCK